MAKEANKKNNKNLIIGICAAVAAVVVVIIIAVFALNGGTPKIDDSYFVSDDTKLVLSTEDDDYKIHEVYTYSGDKITGMTMYYEYDDEAAAKAALNEFNASDEEEKEGVKKATVNGKYLVLEVTEDYYEGTTVSDVKDTIEFYESIKNLNLDDVDYDYDYEDEDYDF